MESKGLVFNIQRYSVHDGGGIRTIIFLKGCPLACPWCANPESRKGVEPVHWTKNGKREVIGEWRTITELVDEVMKDEVFYRTSGGGVTISGGEVLMQSNFATQLLKVFYELGVHTAIETTGCFPLSHLQNLAPYLNQVLFDLKIMDSEKSKRIIGINVEYVKANLEFLLSQKHIEVVPRVPLIPDYTVDEENLSTIANYISFLGIKEVHLLPFHQYGSSKYEYLGWKYIMKDTPTLTQTEILSIRQIFEDRGIFTNVDGLE